MSIFSIFAFLAYSSILAYLTFVLNKELINIAKKLLLAAKNHIWIILGCIILLLISIFFLDKEVSLYFLYKRDEQFNKIALFLANIGEPKFLFLGSSALFSLSYFLSKFNKSNEKYIKNLFIAICSMTFAQLTSIATKFLILRERPCLDLEPKHFFSYDKIIYKLVCFNGDLKSLLKFFSLYLSFPSGHTLVLTALILPFIFLNKNIFLRIILILAIIAVSLSRIYLLKHWLSDVVFAWILAYFITFITVKIFKKFNN